MSFWDRKVANSKLIVLLKQPSSSILCRPLMYHDHVPNHSTKERTLTRCAATIDIAQGACSCVCPSLSKGLPQETNTNISIVQRSFCANPCVESGLWMAHVRRTLCPGSGDEEERGEKSSFDSLNRTRDDVSHVTLAMALRGMQGQQPDATPAPTGPFIAHYPYDDIWPWQADQRWQHPDHTVLLMSVSMA